jgi:DNA-binding CsgD family transcriptional regulator
MELSEKARLARNAYQKRFRQKNPDKIRQYNVRYWEKLASDPSRRARELQSIGYTQRQIAEELKISLGAVNAYLNNE